VHEVGQLPETDDSAMLTPRRIQKSFMLRKKLSLKIKKTNKILSCAETGLVLARSSGLNVFFGYFCSFNFHRLHFYWNMFDPFPIVPSDLWTFSSLTRRVSMTSQRPKHKLFRLLELQARLIQHLAKLLATPERNQLRMSNSSAVFAQNEEKTSLKSDSLIDFSLSLKGTKKEEGGKENHSMCGEAAKKLRSFRRRGWKARFTNTRGKSFSHSARESESVRLTKGSACDDWTKPSR
jgi:hypothetical protein